MFGNKEHIQQEEADEAGGKHPEEAQDDGGARALEEARKQEAERDLHVPVQEVEDDLDACVRAPASDHTRARAGARGL